MILILLRSCESMNLCVPVIKKDAASFIRAVESLNNTSADIIELRVDYLEPLTESAIDQIVSFKSKKPAILTIRMKEEGGMQKIDEKFRENLFLQFHTRVKYVDIEFRALSTAKKIMKDTSSRVILSMHDFEKTPSKQVLDNYIQSAFDAGAYVAKVAVKCNSYDDSIVLLELLEKWKNKNVCIVGMGEYGTLTRVLSPLFNPYLTFVSIDETSKSASGQVTLFQMLQFIEILKKKEED